MKTPVRVQPFFCRRLLPCGIAVLVVCAGCGKPPPERTDAEAPCSTVAAPSTVDSVVARVYPAIVRLDVISESAADGRMRKQRGFGSGVIIRPDGYLITNHHVAGRARRIRCRLADGEEIEGEVVGTDPLSDVTVVRLRMDQRRNPAPLPTAEFGDSDALRVGDTVLAMGSPGGVAQSVTRGIVSNTGLILPGGAPALEGEDVGSLVRWIAHDARIFPGNSGGPLVNLEGKIVGINEIAFAGIGGAIPGNLVRSVADQLIEKGRVDRSWIGIVAQTRPRSLAADRGALVAAVLPDSPGAEAGLAPGDLLLEYDGVAVDCAMPEDLPLFNRLVLSTPIGKEVTVRYLRDGEAREARLTTRRREPARGRDRALPDWGMTARNFTLFSAMVLLRNTTDGVLISSVSAGGAAAQAEPPLQPGDVITEVAGEPIRHLDDLERVTAEQLKDQKAARPVLVTVERGLSEMLSVVRVGPPPTPDRPERTRRPDFPATVQALSSSLAEALGLPDTGGVRVTYVFPGLSVDQAGIRLGDIITRFGDTPVRARRPEEAIQFTRMVRARRIGETVPIELLREGRKITVEMVLSESRDPSVDLDRFEARSLDFEARALTLQERALRKLPEEIHGVLIERVEDSSAAQLAGLVPGDLLLKLADRPTPDIAALQTAVEEVEAEKPRFVLLFVRRGVHTMFIEIEPDWRQDHGEGAMVEEGEVFAPEVGEGGEEP